MKAEKRQRDQQRKQKISENRKHLANVRVVQKNLVFVVGLPPRLADAEVILSYFLLFIYTLYLYFTLSDDNNEIIFRSIHLQILKKHEYFGKYGKIHKVVINPSTTYAGVSGPSASAYVTYCSNNDALRAIQSVNNIMIDGRLIKTSLGTTKYCSHFMKNQQCPKPDCMYLHELGDLEASFSKEEMHQGKHQEYEKRLHDALIAQTAAANNNNNGNANNNSNNTANAPNGKLSECNKQTTENGTQNCPEKNKEAWPSLSVSPVNKDNTGKSNKNGNNKENVGKKTKAEKLKNKKSSTTSTSSSSSNSSTNANSSSSIGSVTSKDSSSSLQLHGKDTGFNITKDNTTGESPKQTMSADEELNLLCEIENDASSNDLDGKADTPSLSLSCSGDSGTVSESVSGKSSPTNFSDHATENGHSGTTQQDVDKQQNKANLEKNSQSLFNDNFGTSVDNNTEINTNCHPLTSGITNSAIDSTSRFSKLGLFDDNNSFFSSNTFQPSPFFKLESSQTTQLRNADTNNQTNSPQLPDLLSGTESDKERHDLHDKLNLLKGLGDYNPQLGNLQNGFGSNGGLEELQKRRNLVNGLGLHSSGLLGEWKFTLFYSIHGYGYV